MKRFILIERDELPTEEFDSLWDQGVDLDDWDYILAFEEPSKIAVQQEDEFNTYYAPKSYTVERLLTGCCINRWYKANLFGKPRMIGIAYHA